MNFKSYITDSSNINESKKYTKEEGIKLLNELSKEYKKKINLKTGLIKEVDGDLVFGFNTFENKDIPGGVSFYLKRDKLEVGIGSSEKFDKTNIKNILSIIDVIKDIEHNFNNIEEYMIKQKEIERNTDW